MGFSGGRLGGLGWGVVSALVEVVGVGRCGAVVKVCPVVGRGGLLTCGEKVPLAASGEGGWRCLGPGGSQFAVWYV